MGYSPWGGKELNMTGYYKKTKISVDEDVEKKKTLFTVGRNEIGAAIMKNNMRFPQKLKKKLLYDPEILLLNFYPKMVKTLAKDVISTPY